MVPVTSASPWTIEPGAGLAVSLRWLMPSGAPNRLLAGALVPAAGPSVLAPTQVSAHLRFSIG